MLQKSTHFFPDGLLDQVRAQLLVPAEPHPTETVGIRTDAVVVCVRTLMVFASAWTDGFAIISIPATGTDNQALQQIFGTSLRNTSALPVFLQLFLNRIKEGCIDQSRHWNAHPLFGRNILMGISMFGLQGPPPLRSQSRTQRLNHRFAKGYLAFVSRIVEHPANRGTVPDRFASSGLLLGCFQTTTNLSNGAPIS